MQPWWETLKNKKNKNIAEVCNILFYVISTIFKFNIGISSTFKEILEVLETQPISMQHLRK